MSLFVDFELLCSLIFFHLSRFRNQISPPNVFLGKFQYLFSTLKHYNLAIYVVKWLQIWFTSSTTHTLQDCRVEIFTPHWHFELYHFKSNDVFKPKTVEGSKPPSLRFRANQLWMFREWIIGVPKMDHMFSCLKGVHFTKYSTLFSHEKNTTELTTVSENIAEIKAKTYFFLGFLRFSRKKGSMLCIWTAPIHTSQDSTSADCLEG